MNKTILLTWFLCIMIFSSVAFASDTYQVTVRPKIAGGIQPSTTFNYEFLFTSDNGCSNIYKNATTSITTDQYGIGYAELDMTGLSGNPDYLCEIRDGSLRKVHNVSLGFFEDVGIRSDERYFFDNLRTKYLSWISGNNWFQFNDNVNIVGNVSSNYFIGDGSLLTNLPVSSYWNKTGTVLEPATAGNSIKVPSINITQTNGIQFAGNELIIKGPSNNPYISIEDGVDITMLLKNGTSEVFKVANGLFSPTTLFEVDTNGNGTFYNNLYEGSGRVCTSQNGFCNQTSSYWNRIGAILEPATAGDDISMGVGEEIFLMNGSSLAWNGYNSGLWYTTTYSTPALELWAGNNEDIWLTINGTGTVAVGNSDSSTTLFEVDYYGNGTFSNNLYEGTGRVCTSQNGFCNQTSGGGGNVTAYYFDAYDNTGGNIITSSWQDLNLTTERIKSGFTHTGSLPDVTITNTGTYVIQSRVSGDMSGTNRDYIKIRLMRDSGSGYVEIGGSYGWGYTRNTAIGEGTATTEVMMNLNAGDKIKVQYQSTGVSTSTTIADGSGLTIYNTGGTAGNDTSGYWSRTGTTITPATSGDDLEIGDGTNNVIINETGINFEGTTRPYKKISWGANEMYGIAVTVDGNTYSTSTLYQVSSNLGIVVQGLLNSGTGNSCVYSFVLPDNYVDGTDIIITDHYTQDGTSTGNVVMGVGAKPLTDTDVVNGISYVTDTDTVGLTSTQNSKFSHEFTITGTNFKGGDTVHLVSFRHASDASDTYYGNTYLLASEVKFLVDEL